MSELVDRLRWYVGSDLSADGGGLVAVEASLLAAAADAIEEARWGDSDDR
jgi:hypothetical protein